jgi:hypothetical protein
MYSSEPITWKASSYHATFTGQLQARIGFRAQTSAETTIESNIFPNSRDLSRHIYSNAEPDLPTAPARLRHQN